jgi:hypothetical protein
VFAGLASARILCKATLTFLFRINCIRLSKVINSDFINRLSSFASKSGSSPQSKGGDSVSLSATLNFGARNFSGAVQKVNSVVNTLNIAEVTLTSMQELVLSAKDLAEEAADADTSFARRSTLSRSYDELADEFRSLVSSANKNEIGENKIFSEDGLNETFQIAGLDPDESKGISELFQGLELDEDGSFWDDIVDDGNAFDGSVNLTDRYRAKAAADQLEEVSGRFASNLEFVAEGKEIVSANLELARAAGFAFLDLSEEVNESAEIDDAVDSLVARIRKAGSAALKQAENLESMTVAALVKDDFNQKKVKKS